VSSDGETAFATVGFDTQKLDSSAYDAADRAVQAARDAGVQVEYDGSLGYAKVPAGGNSEMIGILVAIVVLVFAFGSLVAMSLPIATALVGIGVGSSVIGLMSGFLPMPSIAGVVGLMLGLGAGIDYALFILARHRQNLASGLSVPVAIGRANATAGQSVLFAGLTVIIAILGLNVAGIPMMSMMGYASAVMVAITMVAAAPGCRSSGHSPRSAPTAAPRGGLRGSWLVPSGTPSQLRWCSASSPCRRSRCTSASPTPGTTHRRRRPARPTT
jgi:RND superfamily putative drug exporter